MSRSLVVHILADSIDDTVGGLERSVRRVAGYLSSGLAERVFIYCRKLGKTPWVDRCECVDFGAARSQLASPLVGSSLGISRDERFRLDGLLLRGALERQLRQFDSARHVVLSFFATSCGFIAQMTCSALGLPHVCCIRGSDFSRGGKTPEGLYALEFSCRHAHAVVTTSEEQRRFLEMTLCPRAELHTIYNACDLPPSYPLWRPKDRAELQIFTDTGCSYKKGTHLCLDAVQGARRLGLKVCLTIAGNIKENESAYWAARLGELERQPEFEFTGRLATEKLRERLLDADLYISGSLGEGCPNSVLTVMGLGLPAVLPTCGAIPELVAGMDHTWLFCPGDGAGMQAALAKACDVLSNGPVTVNEEAVTNFRNRYSEEAEAAAWQGIVWSTAQRVAGIRTLHRPGQFLKDKRHPKHPVPIVSAIGPDQPERSDQ